MDTRKHFHRPSRTKQSSKDECDINVIIRQQERGQLISHVNTQSPAYGDFATNSDFHDTQNRVLAAQAAFDALPSDIRSRMGNDPGTLVDFMADETNHEEALELGLLGPPPMPSERDLAASKVPITPEVETPQPSPVAGGD